jgi:hypothetical protein
MRTKLPKGNIDTIISKPMENIRLDKSMEDPYNVR